jgi:microcystin-dependent protein
VPVNTNQPINNYTGNGAAVAYPFTFYVISAAHLVVTVDGVVQSLGTNYTITGLRSPTGGTVTFVVAPGAGSAVRLRRVMPYSRTIDYQDAGDLLAQTLDDDIDGTVMLIQQLEYQARFFLRNADTLAGVSPLMPSPQALKLLRWNSAGNALENTDVAGLIPGFVTVTSFAQGLLDDVSQSEAQATLGVTGSADTAKLTSAANVFTKTQTWRFATVASAATLTLADGNLFNVTGTTNISAIASIAPGTMVALRFTGALTIAHGASLVLPGAAGITTAAGDIAIFFEGAAGVWYCMAYTKADGTPVAQTAAPGSIIAFAGTSTPTGYLECNGANVSRTTYAALFAAVGTTWGAGDGVTTFALPDLRRRTLVGKGGTGTGVLGNTVGATGGAETNSHTHSATGLSGSFTVGVTNTGAAGGGVWVLTGQTQPVTISGSTAGASDTNNMPPSAVVGYFIKI